MICRACAVDKPPADFQKERRKCRACVMKMQRERRAKNPGYDKQWYLNRHDQVLASKRGYRERHAERLRVEGRERARKSREDPVMAARMADSVRRSYLKHREILAHSEKLQAQVDELQTALAQSARDAQAIREALLKATALSGGHEDSTLQLVELLVLDCNVEWEEKERLQKELDQFRAPEAKQGHCSDCKAVYDTADSRWVTKYFHECDLKSLTQPWPKRSSEDFDWENELERRIDANTNDIAELKAAIHHITG